MNDETLHIAEIVWNYMLLNQPVQGADCMLVLGSRDDRVAAYAAGLSLKYPYNAVVISGGISHTQDLLATSWGQQTEAEHFLDVYLQNKGVGEVLLESEARNTGDNAVLSYALLRSNRAALDSLLIVTKPYMERRALATFETQWPNRDTKMSVSSMGGSLQDYCNDEQPIEVVINIMVGDLQRIIEYPQQGLQSSQHTPVKVLRAYEQLISAGYTKHLVK